MSTREPESICLRHAVPGDGWLSNLSCGIDNESYPMHWEEEPLREGSERALEREGPLTGDS